MHSRAHAIPDFHLDPLVVQVPPPPRLFLDTHKDAGPIWTLVAHHLGDTSRKQARFHGACTLTDLNNYLPLLVESFGLDHESYLDSIGNLQFTGCWTWDSS